MVVLPTPSRPSMQMNGCNATNPLCRAARLAGDFAGFRPSTSCPFARMTRLAVGLNHRPTNGVWSSFCVVHLGGRKSAKNSLGAWRTRLAGKGASSPTLSRCVGQPELRHDLAICDRKRALGPAVNPDQKLWRSGDTARYGRSDYLCCRRRKPAKKSPGPRVG